MGAVSEPSSAREGSFSGQALALTIFPRSAYSKKYSFAVHYLAACQPLEFVTERYLDRKEPAVRKEILARADKTYGLTPAHVALLAGRVDVLRALIERGANAQAQDYLGWTIAHHAVVLSEGRADHPLVSEAVRLMGGEAAAGRVQNQFGGSYKDFIDLFRDSISPQDEESVCKIQEEGGAIKELSAGEFTHLTGARYINGLRITTKGMYAHWKRHQFNRHCFGSLSAVAPTVDTFCIKQVEKINGHGLFATDAIPKDVCLKGFYGGEFLDFEKMDREGLSEPERLCDTQVSDSQNYRNEFALMNHGLPTVGLEVVQHKGIPQLQARTKVPLESGDELVWDYGHDYPFLVSTPMVELHPAALLQQLQVENSASDISCLKYPYTTPAAWVYLYTIDKLNFNRVIDYLETFRGTSHALHIQFIEALSFINEHLRPASKSAFKEALVRWNQTVATKKTLLALDMLCRLLSNQLEIETAIADVNRLFRILDFFQIKHRGVVYLGDASYRVKCAQHFREFSSDLSKKLCLTFFESVASEQAEWVTLWNDLKGIQGKDSD